nr:zinc finger protein 480-like isoform X1 [Anolis sagrei ordinatus]XP_060616145.1 zinc finger protein 480-like isoform X1 [Anolis sagrei ordinatus]
MEELNTANLEQGTPRERGNARSRNQSKYVTEEPMWKAPKDGNELPGERMQQLWEAQWQEFLKALQSPSSAWGSLPLAQEMPWEDAKAFLASFEQVAKACRWPKEEWVARLLPALSGEAEQAFQSLEAGDRNDYGKVKAAILRTEALRVELHRQHFRQFCCQEIEDPRRVYSQVQELCSRWLKPERHSKEQILELLVLEQFLASLPQDLQGWIRGTGPETCSQAVALAEDFLLKRQEVVDSAKWQGLLDHKDIGTSLQSVEQTLSQPGQQTIFWQVLQEEGRSTQPFGEVKATSLKVEVSQHEGDELEERPGAVPLVNQGDGLLTAETCGQRSDEMGSWNEMKIPQQVESSLTEASQKCSLMTSNSHEMRQQLRGQESKKLVETERKHTKSVIDDDNKASTNTGKPLFSKYGRKYHDVSDEFADLNPRKIDAECYEDGERNTSHRQSLQRSQNVPTGRKLQKCATSENCFKSIAHLASPQQSHTQQKPHQCSQDEKNNLVRHQGSLTEVNSYKCCQCGKCFTQRSSLKSHQVIHTGMKRYTCSQCGNCFTMRSSLKDHQRIHTGEKPYKCSQCAKCFTQRASLKEHQRIHTGEKPYKCSQCAKCFTQRASLKEHQRIHTGEKPYKCSQCGSCFSQRRSLKDHQRIHTGEKPYKCSQCAKCFTQRASLKDHQRIHTGEKPYECSQCGSCFSQRRSLKDHQRIHTGEKPYECSKCGKCFRRRADLTLHQRIHIGE